MSRICFFGAILFLVALQGLPESGAERWIALILVGVSWAMFWGGLKYEFGRKP